MPDAPLAPSDAPEPTEIRSLGLVTATAVLISNMVGTGVFTSLGFQVVDIGSGFALLSLWAIGALLALSGAYCYAELGTTIPRSGGEYVYLAWAWSPRLGFIGGFVSMTAGFAAPIALAAIAFGRYASAVLPLAPGVLTLLVLVLVGAVHARRVRHARRFQLLTTGSTLAVIVAFIVAGLVIGPREPLSFAPSADAWANITSAPFAVSLIYVVYAYTGWNAIGYVAGEIRDPDRTIPRAVLLAVAMVALLYVSLHWVFLRAVPLDALRGTVEVGALAGTRVFGAAGGRLMSGVIALVLVATISGFLYAGARVTQAVGAGTPALGWLGARSEDGVPRRALALQMALVVLLIVTASFEQVLAYTGIVLNLMNLLAVAGLMRMRRREPSRARPFRTPWYPLMPFVFAALSCWMIAFTVWQRPAVVLAALGTLLLGSALYSLTHRPAPAPGA